MACNLPYIPKHLHCHGRENLDEFYINEHLYRRCTPDELSNPFATVSLVDLSVNRSGIEPHILSQPEDVLYNSNPNPEKGIVEEKFKQSICTLEIKELEDNKYLKTFPFTFKDENGNASTRDCIINLCHKKEECNYAHCAFEFHYDNTEVTFENYKTTLGKKGSENSRLRDQCRFEIARMILKKEVRVNWEEN